MRKIPIWTAAIALAATAAIAPAAYADDVSVSPENGGSDTAPGGADSAAAIAKQEMADAYIDQLHGVPGAVTRFQAAAAAFTGLSGAPLPSTGTVFADSGKVSPDQLPPDGGGSTSADTGVIQVGQAKSYYCGPATAYMILKAKDEGHSNYDGVTLSQTHLATDTYLHTESNGSTNFTGSYMERTLNKWIFGQTTGWYVRNTDPSGSQFQTDLVFDVGSNYSLAVDTTEYAGGAHYNSHPNQTIYHWITGWKYTNSGDTAGFADPSTTVWSAPAPKFTYDTTQFASRFLNLHGIVW